MRIDARAAVLLAATVFCTCGDPAMPRVPTVDPDRALVLFGVLNPDFSRFVVQVTTTNVADTALPGLTAELWTGGGRVEVGDQRPGFCGFGSGAVGPVHCVRFEATVLPNRTYTIRVSVPGYPSARASTTVPSPFEIRTAFASGSPPGSDSLAAAWTPSSSVHRYLLAVRADTTPRCFNIRGCSHGWSAATADTSFSGSVPATAYQKGEPPWFLDVYAMDAALFDYLTTGSPGQIFAVPPASNVEGGHGVVGSWVVRSRPIP